MAVSQLSVRDERLCNAEGTPIQLKGLSLGWHNWWPRFYNEGVVEELSTKWKCNVVRAAIGVDHEQGFLRKPEQSIALLKTVIHAAIKFNIYVVVDWHTHTAHETEAIQFFKKIAADYSGYPNIIYEIFNEPVNQSWKKIKDYSLKIIDTVRSVDEKNIILIGSPHWDQDVDIVAKDRIQNDNHIMYSFHFYAATHGDVYRQKLQAALDGQLPIFISECGGMEADGNGELNVRSWNKWMQIIEENYLSWLGWSVADKNETCSILLPTASSHGKWNTNDIKPWGRILKKSLKKQEL